MDLLGLQNIYTFHNQWVIDFAKEMWRDSLLPSLPPSPKCLRFLLLSPLLSNNQAWGKQASVAHWTLKLKCPAMLLWGEWCDLYYSWKDDRNLLRTDKNHHLQFPVAGILWHSLGCVWFIFVQSSLFLGTTSTDLQRPPLQLWNIVKGRKRGRIYYL